MGVLHVVGSTSCDVTGTRCQLGLKNKSSSHVRNESVLGIIKLVSTTHGRRTFRSFKCPARLFAAIGSQVGVGGGHT